MPHAIVLSSASKANLTGGTFADTLVANTGDSLSVASYLDGGARLIEMWGIDSDSVAEGELLYTRPDSTHDQSNGFRFQIPAVALGGAATNAAFNILPGSLEIPVFLNDAATIKISGTAADDVLVTWLTEYDDLPGVGQAQFASWEQVKAMRKSNVGFANLPVASATPGAYGADRAINADDTRYHANTYYAILGLTCQTQVTTVSLKGPAWGGQRIGLPSGSLFLNSNMWFVDQTLKRNRPLIPFFHSADVGNVIINVADGEASTSPHLDWNMVELTGKPGV
jgi:hypothetical protein